jgi:predicted permease
VRVLEDARRDLRYAARALRRSPGFATVAVVSLAFGIGANTAIFTVIDALMLRSLPVERPGELVVVVRNYLGRGSADYVTYPAFERFRDASIFADVTASMTVERSGVRVIGSGGSESETAVIGLVSGTYFSTFGVRAAIGRTLAPGDDRGAGLGPVAVLSEPFWRREFGASPDAVGRTLSLGGTAYAIVGVAQAGFTGENVQETTDVWIPITMQSQVMTERPDLLTNAGSNWVRVIGRLKPEATLAQTEAAARTIFARVSASSSPLGSVRVDLGPAGRGFNPQRAFLAAPLQILMVIVGLVLLIACANVATLLMARAAARQKEIALRIALGANRGRLVRQLLAEGLLISGLAGVSGFLIAIWMIQTLVAMVASGRLALGVHVRPDTHMLGATLALSVLTGLLFGLVPARRGTTLSLTPVLTGSRGARRGGRGAVVRAAKLLVVVQVAASVILTIGAGLFVRTLRNLEMQHVGFDREHVWMFWMAPRQSGLQNQALAPVFAAAQDRIATLPGVLSVSPSDTGVLSGFVGLRAVAAEGHVPAPEEDTNAQWTLVGPRFFDTIGMRLLAGRDFGPQDIETSPHVAVVNEAMARHFFGDASPIGKRFGFGRDVTQLIQVVGVVENAKYFSARDADVRMVFLPYQQDIAHLFRMCVVVRTATTSSAIVTRIRDELRDIAPAVPVSSVNTTDAQFNRALSEERLTAWLSGAFGLLAVALACIGLYGVMSYTVSRRTREIGIRMALGESGASVLRRVLRECWILGAVGVAIGIPAAALSARWVQSRLFGVSASDPLTAAAAALLLLCVALLAGFVPARRASRVDPIVALQTE